MISLFSLEKRTSDEAAARELSSPHPKVFTSVRVGMVLVWAQHLPYGACGEMGWRLRALEVERRPPPPFPLPKPGRSKTPPGSTDPRLAWGREPWASEGRGGCGPSSSWLQALSPKSGQAKGPPERGLSVLPNETIWSQQRPLGAGGVFSQDTHLSPFPSCPRVRTPEQNQAPENQPSRQMARGGRGQLVTLASPRQTLEASP